MSKSGKLPWGVMILRVLDLIEQNDRPISALQIAQMMGSTREKVSSAISKLHKATDMTPKRIYVAKWIDDVDGSRKYTRAAYLAGDKPDVKKPKSKFDFNAWQRKRYAERKALSTGSSVFNVGAKQADWMEKEIRI